MTVTVPQIIERRARVAPEFCVPLMRKDEDFGYRVGQLLDYGTRAKSQEEPETAARFPAH